MFQIYTTTKNKHKSVFALIYLGVMKKISDIEKYYFTTG
jgi:hypothetical protein